MFAPKYFFSVNKIQIFFINKDIVQHILLALTNFIEGVMSISEHLDLLYDLTDLSS